MYGTKGQIYSTYKRFVNYV